MPQFDFANVFIPQLFWLAVFFLVLYFGVVKTTLPRLGKVMTEREDRIAGDLGEARRAKEQADELADRNKAEFERNREEARAVVAAAKDKAASTNEDQLRAADAQLAQELAAAEQAIAAARAKAGAAVRDIAVDSAQAIVVKLTGKEPARATAEQRVDAALTQ